MREPWPRMTHSGENPSLPRIRCRAFDVAAASGAGTTVILDRDYELTQTQPIRYRSVAAATGGFNLPLPTRLKQGETTTLSYLIYAHPAAVTTDDLRQAVGEERP